MHAIAAAALRIISDFDSQALGNTAWAFACCSEWQAHEPLLDALAATALALGKGLHPQSHATLVDAYGTAGGAELVDGLRSLVINFVETGIVATGWRPCWSTQLHNVDCELGRHTGGSTEEGPALEPVCQQLASRQEDSELRRSSGV